MSSPQPRTCQLALTVCLCAGLSAAFTGCGKSDDLLLPVRDEAGFEQAMPQQVSDPFGILDVGLASRHGLDVLRVCQQHLKPVVVNQESLQQFLLVPEAALAGLAAEPGGRDFPRRGRYQS